MTNRLIAGVLAAAVLAGISTIPAEAACKGATHCYGTTTSTVLTPKPGKAGKASKAVVAAAKPKPALRIAPSRKAAVKRASAAQPPSAPRRKLVAAEARRLAAVRRGPVVVPASAIPEGASSSQGNVISLIKAMAPAQGVPTWFALRIAHVESNYNAHMRGSHGEYGVFQMKCSTARDIGFNGSCDALLDPRTNIRWGLRHLAIAIGKADGNLRLAASKHNGGLGRRTLVASYVAKVF